MSGQDEEYLRSIDRLSNEAQQSGVTPSQALAHYRRSLDWKTLEITTRAQAWMMARRTVLRAGTREETLRTGREFDHEMLQPLYDRIRMNRIHREMSGQEWTWAEFCERFIKAEAENR